MANRFKGEITADLDGASYTLRMDMGTMAEFESAVGVDALAWAERAEAGDAKIGDMISMVQCALQRHHEGASRAIASDLLSEDTAILQRLIAAAAPDPGGDAPGNGSPAAKG